MQDETRVRPNLSSPPAAVFPYPVLAVLAPPCRIGARRVARAPSHHLELVVSHDVREHSHTFIHLTLSLATLCASTRLTCHAFLQARPVTVGFAAQENKEVCA